MKQVPISNISSQYLMTAHFPIDPGYSVDDSLMIWNVLAGGWVRGPDISGEIIAPTGDWGRLFPDGTLKMDVRGTIRSDDGALIYMSFLGRFKAGEDIDDRLGDGETIGPDEIHCIMVPTFETGAEDYAWLNQTVAAGKLVSLKDEPDSHVRFDIFSLS